MGRAGSSAAICVDISVLGNVPVGEELEAAMLNNANPPLCASKLPDYAHRDFHGVVGDIVFADRVYVTDRQEPVGVDARSVC